MGVCFAAGFSGDTIQKPFPFSRSPVTVNCSLDELAKVAGSDRALKFRRIILQRDPFAVGARHVRVVSQSQRAMQCLFQFVRCVDTGLRGTIERNGKNVHGRQMDADKSLTSKQPIEPARSFNASEIDEGNFSNV